MISGQKSTTNPSKFSGSTIAFGNVVPSKTAIKCNWCGSACLEEGAKGCTAGKPLPNRECMVENDACVIKIVEPVPTTPLSKCGWCGTKCGPVFKGQACPEIMPPEGSACVLDNNKCVIETEDATSTQSEPQ